MLESSTKLTSTAPSSTSVSATTKDGGAFSLSVKPTRKTTVYGAGCARPTFYIGSTSSAAIVLVKASNKTPVAPATMWVGKARTGTGPPQAATYRGHVFPVSRYQVAQGRRRVEERRLREREGRRCDRRKHLCARRPRCLEGRLDPQGMPHEDSGARCGCRRILAVGHRGRSRDHRHRWRPGPCPSRSPTTSTAISSPGRPSPATAEYRIYQSGARWPAGGRVEGYPFAEGDDTSASPEVLALDEPGRRCCGKPAPKGVSPCRRNTRREIVAGHYVFVTVKCGARMGTVSITDALPTCEEERPGNLTRQMRREWLRPCGAATNGPRPGRPGHLPLEPHLHDVDVPCRDPARQYER